MQVQSKTLRRGVTFISKDDPTKRYVVAMFHKDNDITYISERSFDNFIKGLSSEIPNRATINEFTEDVLDYWVESKQERAQREFEDRQQAREAQRKRDAAHEVALKFDLFYRARSVNLENKVEAADLLARFQGFLDEAYDRGNEEGNDEGFRRAMDDVAGG